MKFLLAAVAALGLIFSYDACVALEIFKVGSTIETIVFYGSHGIVFTLMAVGAVVMELERRQLGFLRSNVAC